MVGRYLRTLQVEPIESPVPEPERGRTHRRKIVSTAPIPKVSQEADMSTEKEQDQNLDAPPRTGCMYQTREESLFSRT
jgi:hypothetical protein